MNLFSAALLFLVIEGLSVQRPQTDFDSVIDSLKTRGAWEEGASTKFFFRPAGKPGWSPYRSGQWLYTDYGWIWKGADADSWVTDHYGYWTRRQTGGWIWVPNGNWLPSTVEWVKSGDYIGWRPGRMDKFNNPLEPENERYSDPVEWNFVPVEKLRGTLQPQDFITGDKAKDLLVNAQPADHTFKSYREIERPGPSPDVLKEKTGNIPAFPVVSDLKEIDAVPEKPGNACYYVYRPRFFQDDDGILRRIELFLHPRRKTDKDQELKSVLGRDPAKKADADKEAEKVEKQLQREREHQDKLYR